MVADDILRLRLRNQHLARQSFDDPAELVRCLGAVQAQDYAGAKWAVGQRIRRATDALVEAAVAEGTILRTHVMRPTWHFVPRDDIRWLLALTSARIKAVLASYDRQLGIDAPMLALSRRAIERAQASVR